MPLLWTNIDHCLHSAELQASAFSTGAQLGSDHWPLKIVLQWRNEAFRLPSF